MADMLNPPADVSVPEGLCLTLLPDDAMFAGNHRHYVSVGQSALGVIVQAVDYADAPPPADILDFGCGAGRVLRWVRHEYPSARIVAADVRAADTLFCAETFTAEAWAVPIELGVGGLATDHRFDLIWAGSVMTHLGPDDTKLLFAKFVSWLKPGGVAVTSLHGSHSFRQIVSGNNNYGLNPADLVPVTDAYAEAGYGYIDYPHAKGYGLSLTKPSWAIRMVRETPDASLLLYLERAWDNHHDVIAARRA